MSSPQICLLLTLVLGSGCGADDGGNDDDINHDGSQGDGSTSPGKSIDMAQGTVGTADAAAYGCEVTAVSPGSLTSSVATTATIEVRIIFAGMTAETATTGVHLRRAADNTDVGGTWQLPPTDNGDLVAVFTPTAPLAADSVYSMHVGDGGGAYCALASWQSPSSTDLYFTTSTQPTVRALQGPELGSAPLPLLIRFSEAMDPATVTVGISVTNTDSFGTASTQTPLPGHCSQIAADTCQFDFDDPASLQPGGIWITFAPSLRSSAGQPYVPNPFPTLGQFLVHPDGSASWFLDVATNGGWGYGDYESLQ